MIHILTTHVGTDRWVELQREHVTRHTPEPHRVWAAVSERDVGRASHFHHAEPSRGPVGVNLNRLAELVISAAEPDELLVFLDGDAFPVGDWIGVARGWLSGSPLAAVRRDENVGDPQPHHLFCVTTVGFWKRIGGDWRRGPLWVGSTGRPTTDHGARLLRILNGAGVDWHPILRSNRRDLHPLWFAVYGDVVYHHGAGFRTPRSRLAGEQFRDRSGPLGRLARWRAERATSRLSATLYQQLRASDDPIEQLMTFPEQQGP